MVSVIRRVGEDQDYLFVLISKEPREIHLAGELTNLETGKPVSIRPGGKVLRCTL